MRKLRYKGNTKFDKDEVLVDRKCSHDDREKSFDYTVTQKFFGSEVFGTDIVPVKFYIYKKKASWIQWMGDRGGKIEFTYDIIPTNSYSEQFVEDPEPNWKLQFFIKGEDNPIEINVNDSCFPKKIIIKHLLNALVSRHF